MSGGNIRWVGDVAERRRKRTGEKAPAKKAAPKDTAEYKPCLTCGKTIRVLPWMKRVGSGKYCSKACVGESNRRRFDADGNWPRYPSEAKAYENYVKPRREANPAQTQAHSAVSAAIRSGEMVRGACEVCGTEDMVDAHHDDYSQPLNVRWLCRRHHLMLHARPDEFAQLLSGRQSKRAA